MVTHEKRLDDCSNDGVLNSWLLVKNDKKIAVAVDHNPSDQMFFTPNEYNLFMAPARTGK